MESTCAPLQLVDEVCREGDGRSPSYGRLILDTQL
jgi:hypothetical protein